MDFELNNKALLVESVIASHLQDKLENKAELKTVLDELVSDLPEIRAVEIFRLKDQENLSFTTTSSLTKAVYDPVLNYLAFSSDEAFSKEINASLGEKSAERMWLVASPMYDNFDKKVGVINTYVSAAQIDAITQRTVNDSIKILLITLVVILLLLINHFSLFERAVAFVKLKEVDELKDDFISIAAHELKTPLTIINSYAYLLTKNKHIQNNAEMQGEISKIVASSNRLGILVKDLLDVSRIEMNRLELDIGIQDLGEIVSNVVDQLIPEAHIKKLTLVYQKPENRLFIKGDKNKLEQIFINLIGNSIKYTIDGSVTISHVLEKHSVKTNIKDTGVGIPLEKMNKLFDKFSRIYNEKTKDVPGTGLGLWITKELISTMGGKVYVESIENTGSQFSVGFPLESSSETNTLTTTTQHFTKIDISALSA
jgi:signal transduction histidine kinase